MSKRPQQGVEYPYKALNYIQQCSVLEGEGSGVVTTAGQPGLYSVAKLGAAALPLDFPRLA